VCVCVCVFRASRIWKTHFVTCAICSKSFSKHSQEVGFCGECKCYVCVQCNCSVFHLSYQVRGPPSCTHIRLPTYPCTTPGGAQPKAPPECVLKRPCAHRVVMHDLTVVA
jgi:hypothetical protein